MTAAASSSPCPAFPILICRGDAMGKNYSGLFHFLKKPQTHNCHTCEGRYPRHRFHEYTLCETWIPAYAGMTNWEVLSKWNTFVFQNTPKSFRDYLMRHCNGVKSFLSDLMRHYSDLKSFCSDLIRHCSDLKSFRIHLMRQCGDLKSYFIHLTRQCDDLKSLCSTKIQ